MADPDTYCASLVREHDPDRFLLSLSAKGARRRALWALYAFNYEIAKTREVVTETTIGLIRLQWWQDAVAAIYDKAPVPKNMIVEDMAQAVHAFGLTRKSFETLLYAREFDLEDTAPESLDGLMNYADFTCSPLVRLSLEVLGQAEEDAVAGAAARAYALTGILRAIPFHMQDGHCLLPQDVMAAHGISAENYGHADLGALSGVVRELAAQAEAVLPPRVKSPHVREIKALTRLYLGQLKALDYNVFDSRMRLKPPFFYPRYFLKKRVA